MWKCGFGIDVLIVHCHCSLFNVIVNEQCCNNIVGGLVLRWADLHAQIVSVGLEHLKFLLQGPRFFHFLSINQEITGQSKSWEAVQKLKSQHMILASTCRQVSAQSPTPSAPIQWKSDVHHNPCNELIFVRRRLPLANFKREKNMHGTKFKAHVPVHCLAWSHTKRNGCKEFEHLAGFDPVSLWLNLITEPQLHINMLRKTMYESSN